MASKSTAKAILTIAMCRLKILPMRSEATPNAAGKEYCAQNDRIDPHLEFPS